MKRGPGISDTLYGYLLLIPVALLIVCIFLLPIVRCFALSFCEHDIGKGGEIKFAGIKNFIRLAGDKWVINPFINTLFFTVVSVLLEFIIGFAFALILAKAFATRGLARGCALIPWTLPPAIIAMAWLWIFNDQYGIFGDILLRLGIIKSKIAWLGSPEGAMASLIFADVWKTAPFICLILLAGLQSIPRDLYEAISIDGAGKVRQFFLLTLPLLRPYIVVALLFRSIQAFGIFDLVWVITRGGPGDATRMISLHIYDLNFHKIGDLGYAAAVTIATAMFLFIVALIFSIFLRKRVEF